LSVLNDSACPASMAGDLFGFTRLLLNSAMCCLYPCVLAQSAL